MCLLEVYSIVHSRNAFRGIQEGLSITETCPETTAGKEELERERAAHTPGAQAGSAIKLALSSSRG